MSVDTSLSDQASARLQALRHLGPPTTPPGTRSLLSSHGQDGRDEQITLGLAVDQTDVIRAARFTSPATGVLLLAYEVMAELCVGISLKQAAHITPLQVKRKLELSFGQTDVELPWPDDEPFPILAKICNHQVAKTALASDADSVSPWNGLGLFEKVRRIESVLDDHVRPMLATDGGGIDLLDLQGDELVVQYHGACGSCSSSLGGTLAFIEDTLNDALVANLRIRPEGLDPDNFVM